MPKIEIIKVHSSMFGTYTEYRADGLLGREPGDVHPAVLAQTVQQRRKATEKVHV